MDVKVQAPRKNQLHCLERFVTLFLTNGNLLVTVIP
jgi:hypothetical protein